MQRLPKTLAREPLVDAVFEIRASGMPQLADILPGLLFGQFDPKPAIRRLPTAEIPLPIRSNDPGLMFSPIIQLELQNFLISFGDRNIVIACKMPYPKWPAFSEFILDTTNKISKSGIPLSVERYSLKYVNLIEGETIADQIKKINISVKVGDVDLRDDHSSVQIHSKEDGILHIISVVTGALARLPDGRQIGGTVLDIDSIRDTQFADFPAFAGSIQSDIQSLRLANKTKFFSCLTEQTIQALGPEYD